MIRDLSQSLQNLLEDPALAADFPELEAAAIVFDRPDSNFNPTQNSVDLFLYDIREDVELRSNQPRVERNGANVTVHKPPMRLDCSYLVTAWPVSGANLPLQEHRLLSQTLQVLLRHPTLDDQYLAGQLAGQEVPLPVIAPETDGLKGAGEFWTSLGSQLRASFSVSVTIGVPALPPVTGPIVTTKRAGFGVGSSEVTETLLQIGGRVLDPTGNPVPDATVDLLTTFERALTDEQGRYLLSNVKSGDNRLRITAVGFQRKEQVVTVPGPASSYEITLAPI